jgi:hypothetical protein
MISWIRRSALLSRIKINNPTPNAIVISTSLSTSISGSSKAYNKIAAITSVINPKMTNLISFIEDMGFVVLFTFLAVPESSSR